MVLVWVVATEQHWPPQGLQQTATPTLFPKFISTVLLQTPGHKPGTYQSASTLLHIPDLCQLHLNNPEPLSYIQTQPTHFSVFLLHTNHHKLPAFHQPYHGSTTSHKLNTNQPELISSQLTIFPNTLPLNIPCIDKHTPKPLPCTPLPSRQTREAHYIHNTTNTIYFILLLY